MSDVTDRPVADLGPERAFEYMPWVSSGELERAGVAGLPKRAGSITSTLLRLGVQRWRCPPCAGNARYLWHLNDLPKETRADIMARFPEIFRPPYCRCGR